MIKIWDVETANIIKTLQGHFGGILKICLTSDDKSIISSSGDMSIKIWNI